MPWKLIVTIALVVSGIVAFILARRASSDTMLEYEVYPSGGAEPHPNGDMSGQAPSYAGGETLGSSEGFQHYPTN